MELFCCKMLDFLVKVCYNGSISLKTYALYQVILEYLSVILVIWHKLSAKKKERRQKMERNIRKLKNQIEGMEFEKNRLIRAYRNGELTEYPSVKVRDLNKQILKLSSELSELRRCDPGKYDVKSSAIPNPIELMFTWCDVFIDALMITWLCLGVAAVKQGESGWFAFLGIGIIVAVMGIPGALAQELLEFARNKVGDVIPVYRCSSSILSGGIKQTYRRCQQRNSRGIRFTIFLLVIILTSDVICIFRPSSSIIAIVGFLFLSVGGFIVIGVRVASDIYRETRKARQVF